MDSINVNLERNGYEINIGAEILDNLISILTKEEKWMIITDNNVEGIYGEHLEKSLVNYTIFKYIVPSGEKSKTLDEVVKITNKLIENGFTRRDKIIALGGGVVGDLAGFCASVYMRGISFVQIPTTLLAQVDSSVGGKTGINLPEAKNIIGAFHQPEMVMADTSLLKTLPEREIISGLGEVIKYGIIEDYDFFKYVNDNLREIINVDQRILPAIIKRCCEIKAHIVIEDEREKGLRKNLNFGHTIGHALETITNYKRYTHGEAVIIGMYYESKLAKDMGLIEDDYFREISTCLEKTGVPLDIDWAPIKEIVEIMGRDKKNQDNKISFILPIGRSKVREFLLASKMVLDLINRNEM